jgi:hypothetical protein
MNRSSDWPSADGRNSNRSDMSASLTDGTGITMGRIEGASNINGHSNSNGHLPGGEMMLTSSLNSNGHRNAWLQSGDSWAMPQDRGGLQVPEQVEKLLKQATDVENLCQHYIGWCSFW